MRAWIGSIGITGGLLAALSGCADAAADRPFTPEYGPAEVAALDSDLVTVRVEMSGARNGDDVSDYTDCVAAQHTLETGNGFARHVRTNLDEEGGIWRADAVYTISPALPEGLRTIDAEVTVADCAEQGIPTV